MVNVGNKSNKNFVLWLQMLLKKYPKIKSFQQKTGENIAFYLLKATLQNKVYGVLVQLFNVFGFWSGASLMFDMKS